MINDKVVIIALATLVIFQLIEGIVKSKQIVVPQMNSPPPLITQKVRIYVSSPLFKMSDLFYGVGINGLLSTEPGGVTSDNIDFDEVEDLAQTLSSTMGIPRGGIAQAIARRGIEAYIPARDGFNMAILIGGTVTYLADLLAAGDAKSDYLKSLGVELSDVAMVGAYLLMAVYAFDMYNLTSRCNCCLFNTSGLAMDDGSVAELGIASARGLPTTIHAPEDYTLFAGGIINPMVAGAASIDLSLNKWKFWNIEEALDDLVSKLKVAQSLPDPQYSHYAGMPYQIDFWNALGEKIWLMRYKSKDSHVTTIDGVVIQKESYTNNYLQATGSSKGQGYIGSIVVGLVKQTQKEFGLPPLVPIDRNA